MNRTLKFVLIAAALVLLLAWVGTRVWEPASDAKTVAIFNLLSHPILDDSVAGIKAELADQGYGENEIRIIEINANGEMDKLNTFAMELLAANPDVIVPVSTPVTQAVAQVAPKDQDIIFSTVTNPDDVGMQNSPDNMTGTSDAVNYEANIDLIQQIVPDVSNIGMIYNSGERNSQFGVEQTKAIVDARGLNLVLVTVASSGEVSDAARSLIGSVDVFYVGSDNTVVSAIDALLSTAYENGIPVIASDIGSVQNGAVAAISVDYEKVGRAAGELTAQVLETGQRAGSLDPVVVVGDTLVINRSSLEKINLVLPSSLEKDAVEVQ